MASRVTQRLLAQGEPSPVEIVNGDGRSPYVLTCEHAGRRIPAALGTLGLGEADLRRHIAWDIGIAGVARRLAQTLDAPLVLQTYSRLVIDCNRSVERPDSIAVVSEATEIPGNRGIADEERRQRADEVFWPYHRTIAELLDHRRDDGAPTILIAMHSFTPVFKEIARPWHLGLLFNRDDRVARRIQALAAEEPSLCIGINEPYAISDLSDYTVPVHGERRGIPHIEFEIRQDLIEHEAGQDEWAGRLAGWLAGIADVAAAEQAR